MTELLFKNPVFKPGLNVTVRRGTKWNFGAKSGVVIKDTFDKMGLPIAVVTIETFACIFRDLVDEDVANEHDPECQRVQGLLDVMKRVYPGFTESEVVTVVSFWMPDPT